MIRETKETKIIIDFSENNEKISTGDKVLNHLLKTMFFYMNKKICITVEKWDLKHHLWEDTGIVVGEALSKDKNKIKRFGSAIMPMDDALVLVSLDISRTYTNFEIEWNLDETGFEKSLIEEFLKGLSRSLSATLHIKTLSGQNAHHVTEAIFKGLGIALKQALQNTDTAISTKGTV